MDTSTVQADGNPGGAPRRSAVGRRILRWVAGAFAALVIVIALLVGLFRMVVPSVPQYRGEVEEWASAVLRAPVEITDMDLQWRGLRPEVVLGNVRFVTADARTALAVRELRIGLSYRSLFRAGRIAPARIVLNEPDLTWVLAAGTGEAEAPVAAWIETLSREDRRGELVVNDGRLSVHADDGRQFPFQRINGRAHSDGHNHELHLSMRAPGFLGRTLTVDGAARGRPGTPAWTASAFIDAQRIDTAALHALIGPTRLTRGTMDLGVRLEILGDDLGAVDVDMGLHDFAWEDPATGMTQVVADAGAEIHWRRRSQGWSASIERLSVGRESGTTESGQLALEYMEPAQAGEPALWRMRGERLWLQDLGFLWMLSLQHDELMETMLQHEPRGRVTGLDVAIRHAPGAASRWAVEARGEGLAWQSVPGSAVPGVDGLDIELDGDERDGHVTLGGGVVVDLPEVFRGPLPRLDLDGELAWQRAESGHELAVPRLSLQNDDIESLVVSGRFRLPEDGPLHYDLEADFDGIDMARGNAYLPAELMLPGLLRWLDRGPVLEGVARDGRFELRGPGEPHLLVEYDTEELHLDFADRWPRLRGVRARMRFQDRLFEVDVEHGWLVGAEIQGARVRIPDMAAELRVLDIEGRFGDDLGALKTAYLVTPPGGEMGEWFEHGEAGGRGLLELEIQVPLQAETRPRFSGRLDMTQASFTPGGIEYGLEDIDGRLHIEDGGVSADGVAARLLGRPISVDVEGATETDVAVIKLQGTLDRGLFDAFDLDLDGLPLSGASTWHAWVRMPREGDAPTAVRLHSDLEGIALDLPAPLGKTADETRDLDVHLGLLEDARVLRVDMPARLHAEFALREHEDGWHPHAASVHIGAGMPRALPAAGMVLTGWLSRWRLETVGAGAGAFAGLQLDEIDLGIAEVEAFGRSLGDTRVRADRTPSGWYVRLEGDRVAGVIELPDAPVEDNPYRLELERLHLERALLHERGDAPADPHAVPPVAFHVRDFASGDIALGEVNGMLRPIADGVALDGFVATAPEHRMTLEGSWLTDGMHHSTAVRGTLDSTDVQATLAALGYGELMEAAAGHLEWDVSWPDLPYGDVLEGLSGQLQVRIERGALLDVEPGAGRMFGLLSIQALPRRLALDFSDVFRRGMSFDSIRGSFRIERGQAYTDDLRLVGPAARIEVSGRTGLATRDYDQVADVTGSLASSLTLAGALAGGPAVGAALLIASELLKAPLEEMARARYHLTGDWDDPEIERLADPSR